MTITDSARRLALVAVVAMLAALLPVSGAFAQDTDPDEGPLEGEDIAYELSGEENAEIAQAWSELAYSDGTVEGEAGPTEVLLGRDDVFADSLASGSLQGSDEGDVDDDTDDFNGRPLLLTDTDELSETTADELERLGGTEVVTTVHILGGENAVSQDVADELEEMGYEVNRFEGETRTETAIDIAAGAFADADTALLVRSEASSDDETQAFADSLGAGAWAAEAGIPILFTQPETLTGTTAEYLESSSIENVIIIGGDSAVSEGVEMQLGEGSDDEEGMGMSVERVEGDTRFTTAIAINEARDLGGDAAIVVDGQVDDAWVNGFAAANVSGNNGYPLVLSNNGELPDASAEYLEGFYADEDAAEFAAHLTNVVLICGTNAGDACDEAAEIAGVDEITAYPPPAEPVDPGPGDNETFTDAPELVRVETVSQSQDRLILRYVFDEQVTGKAPVAECFHVYSFDLSDIDEDDDGLGLGSTAQDCDGTDDSSGGHAGDVNQNPASIDGNNAVLDGDSVRVQFGMTGSNIDMNGLTVATVDWDAVQDDARVENLEGNFPLSDVEIEPGTTSAPDLESVVFNPNEASGGVAVGTVDFVFDQNAMFTGDASDFVLINDDGTRFEATAAMDDPDNDDRIVASDFVETDDTAAVGVEIAVAQFDDDIVRAAVLSDAVAADDGDLNPLQTVPVGGTSDTTDDPDLTAVAIMEPAEDGDSPTTVTYTFDEPVNITGDNVGSGAFSVYFRDGEENSAGTAVRSTTNNREVVVTFADGVLDGAVGASVADDAVTSITGAADNVTNDEGELPLAGQTFEAGTTTAPDLVSAQVALADDLGGGIIVEYVFDEDVDDTGSIDASRFFVYDSQGNPTRADSAEQGDEDNTVRVTFDDDDDVDSAVTATVNDQAVFEDGNVTTDGGNVEAQVGLDDPDNLQSEG